MRSQAELLIQIIKDNPGIRSRKDCIHDSEWTQCLTLSALKMHFSISALLNKSFVTRRQHNAGGTFGSIQVMYWKPHNLKVVRKMVNPKISSALMVKCEAKIMTLISGPTFIKGALGSNMKKKSISGGSSKFLQSCNSANEDMGDGKMAPNSPKMRPWVTFAAFISYRMSINGWLYQRLAFVF